MQGLNDKEVIENRKKYGNNSVDNSNNNSFFKILLNTLGDPIIKILLIALAIKVIVLFKNFDWYETIGIVIAILAASFISTISEYGSEKSFQKLQEELSKIKCKVIRNGKKDEIIFEDIVVGDIVYLEPGDKIPADGVIVLGKISVDESSLNGETKEIYKNTNSEVYKGSVVYSGNAYVKISNVGKNTQYGKIALELLDKQPETPLKLKLRHLAKIISAIGYVGSFLVFFSYMFKIIVINNNYNLDSIILTIKNFPYITGHILYALTLCVTVIIVSVPEGLPLMVTLVLSSNMKRMIKDSVLVRKLVGIETSGNINILFTDKTGTLTKGKLEVTGFIDGDNIKYDNLQDLKKNLSFYEYIKKSCIINNESSYSEKSIIGGNSTDRALLSFFKQDYIKYKKNIKIPFDSKIKYSSTESDGIIYSKGAPEILLSKCDLYLDKDLKIKKINKLKIRNEISKYTKQGIRVIALVYSSNSNSDSFIFLSLVLIKDEIRKETISGVKNVKNAGIKIVMITGDNENTAKAIGEDVGIYSKGDLVLTGSELALMSDDELKLKINDLKIVARSLPSDKSRLVRVSQEMGLVVGMTGDGVNDAPALKKADVGFSMGSGTEVAKEASDIVILDNNFLSISKSILFGRTIFKSIRKFIIVQLTINICALLLSILGPFLNVEMPITVIQMLWINMVMDTFAGVAFSFEPALIEYLNEPSKSKNESIINKYMLNQIFVTGLYSFVLCILFLKIPIISNLFLNQEHLYTAFFGMFIFIDIFNSFNARTNKINIFSNIIKNKVFIIIMTFVIISQVLMIYYGGSIFRTTGLNLKEFYIMIFLSATVIPFDWIRKYYLQKKGKNTGV